MLCENAYYKSDKRTEKPCCNVEQKIKDDDMFKDRCPFIYWCSIDERFENTIDISGCKYREKNNDR